MAEIDAQIEAPGFWDNPGQNAPILRQRRALERRLETLKRLRHDGEELAAWRELLSTGAPGSGLPQAGQEIETG